jgi:hypothetical protein
MALMMKRAAPLALLAVAAAAALPSTAQADWRYGHRHRGGDVAAGLIGGLAAGALIGGALAAQPRGYYAPPPPPYAVRPTYYYREPPVACYWTRQKVWLDSWTYQVRRVQVCE